MDIIVTTPKSRMTDAAQEAEDCKRSGGGRYFRNLGPYGFGCNIGKGDRVYYVEDAYIRGFAIVDEVKPMKAEWCDTTGRQYGPGFYVYMDAASWKWIKPIPTVQEVQCALEAAE